MNRQILTHPHSHSWRLIFPDGTLASVAASPIIDRLGVFNARKAMTPGHKYQCAECYEVIKIDDPVGIVRRAPA